MNFWIEKFDNWLFIYVMISVLVVLVAYPNFIVSVLFVMLFQLQTQKSNLGIGIFHTSPPDSGCEDGGCEGERLGTHPATVFAVVCQLSTLGVAVISMKFVPALFGIWLPVVFVLLIIGAIFTVISEQYNGDSPSPRYGRESLLITCFSIAYMATVQLPIGSVFIALIIVHLGVFSLTIMRNLRVVYSHNAEPINRDRTILSITTIALRDQKGWPALRSVFRLPSTIVGVTLVLFNIALLIMLK